MAVGLRAIISDAARLGVRGRRAMPIAFGPWRTRRKPILFESGRRHVAATEGSVGTETRVRSCQPLFGSLWCVS